MQLGLKIPGLGVNLVMYEYLKVLRALKMEIDSILKLDLGTNLFFKFLSYEAELRDKH